MHLEFQGLNVEEADRVLQELWERDVKAWDTYWVPIFRKFARDLVTDAQISAGNVVLDVGTGTGVAAEEVLKRAKASAVGIDRSGPMLELARQKIAGVMTSIGCNGTGPVGRLSFTETTLVLARFGTKRKDRSFES